MYSEIKLLVIDANPQEICGAIARIPDFECCVTGVATTYYEAVMQLNSRNYDVVLLDVSFGGNGSSAELGKMINREFARPFVFMSAENDAQHAAYMAVDIYPSAYLSKPLNTIAVMVTLQNIMRSQVLLGGRNGLVAVDQPAHCFVKIGDKYKKIDWKDIVYMRSENRYTCIFNAADKKEYPIRSTLIKTLQDIVPRHMHHEFLQINRAEAVQLSYITEFSGDEVKTLYNTMHLSEGFGKQLRSKVLFLA